MGVPENIDALLVKYDITQEALARIADVTPGAVTGWRKGSKPRNEAIKNICDHFGLVQDDLLSDHYGLAAKEHGEFLSAPQAVRLPGAIKPHPMKMAYAPLRGSVHAGEWSDTDTLSEELILIPEWVIEKDPDTYVCRVEGDCMSRVYPEGCLIAVSPNSEPQNGSVAVVSIDYGDVMMRKIYRTSKTLILSPDSYNDEYEDIIITLDDDHVIEFGGKVTWFQPWDEM